MTPKRLISFLLAAIMVLALWPSAVLADDLVPYLDENGAEQSVSRSVLTVIGEGQVPPALSGGWYLLTGTVTVDRTLPVTGQAHLILEDGSMLDVRGENNKAGVQVTSGAGLTLYAQSEGEDMGRLSALGGVDGAGIGGGKSQAAGNITINGGSIRAEGKGTFTFGGGAGIGGGRVGNGGQTVINGGQVTAIGGLYGAGIGGGDTGSGGIIIINGGQVTAVGGGEAHNGGGAGIGGGWLRPGGNITINGGDVDAEGGEYAAGIGGGTEADGGVIAIHGGTITARGKDGLYKEAGAGIGGGGEGGGGSLLITGGQVRAQGGGEAPGAGPGAEGEAGTVRIEPAEGLRIQLRASNTSGSPDFEQTVTYPAAYSYSGGYSFFELDSETLALPLPSPGGLGWNGAAAGWQAVSGAAGYQIRLLKNGETVIEALAVSGTSQDFLSFILEEGTGSYSFLVRALGDGLTWLDSPWSEPGPAYAYEAPPVQTFSDVPPSAWFYSYVENLYAMGIIGGFAGTDEFRPRNPITREQVAKMVVEGAGIEHQGLVADFDDVPASSWASSYIAALVAKGAVSGYKGTNNFGPKDNIKRSHAAKIVALAFDLKMGSLDYNLSDLPSDPVLNQSIRILASNGIVKGYSGTDLFQPDLDISRAEFAKVIIISMAVAGVEKAESLMTREAVDAAQALVNLLPWEYDSLTRSSLQARLDALLPAA